jgi:hypothetical protein
MVGLGDLDEANDYRGNSSAFAAKRLFMGYMAGICAEGEVGCLMEMLDESLGRAFGLGAGDGRAYVAERRASPQADVLQAASILEQKAEGFRQDYAAAAMELDIEPGTARAVEEYFMLLCQRLYVMGYFYGGAEAVRDVFGTRSSRP